MQTEKWSAVTNRGTILNLNAVSNNAESNAEAYDNSTNLDRFATAELNVTFASAPAAGSSIDLYILPRLDGNYMDGAFGVPPSPAAYVGSFVVRAVTTLQRIATARFELPPTNMNFLAINNATGQPTDAACIVKLYTFNRVMT